MSKYAPQPPLPVPPLQQTLKRYLDSVKPFLTESELKHTQALADKFASPGGQGERLQKKLEEKGRNMDNWLADLWLKHAYLSYRSPVTVFSNFGAVFDLPRHPVEQGERAAEVLYGALQYWDKVQAEDIPQETVDKAPLSMAQYKGIFSHCRIPRPGTDECMKYDRADSRHVIVACRGRFYPVTVYDANNMLLPLQTIHASIRAILDANSGKAMPADAVPVGLFTSQDRDTWARVYHDLEKHPANRESLRSVQSALCVLCLDEGEVKTITDAFSLVLHGGGADANSANRWFDKTQIIVDKHGWGGVVLEHVPLDAPPGVKMMDYAMSEANKRLEARYEQGIVGSSSAGVGAVPCPAPLQWQTYPAMHRDIQAAADSITKLADNLEAKGFVFRGYGREFLKKHRCSPDATFQMALQLAFYRLHGEVGATYETASTRKFSRGRTETIRTVSNASKAFVEAMDARGVSRQDKVALFRAALDSHVEYTRWCMDGQGVDRHLLGLRYIAKEEGLGEIELLKDVAFQRSTHFRLSTSQIAMSVNSVPGFGPLVDDGYGVSYNLHADVIYAGMTRFRDNNATCLRRLAEILDLSLWDFKLLLEPSKL